MQMEMDKEESFQLALESVNGINSTKWWRITQVCLASRSIQGSSCSKCSNSATLLIVVSKNGDESLPMTDADMFGVILLSTQDFC